jgi:hypothetical protein
MDVKVSVYWGNIFVEKVEVQGQRIKILFAPVR